MAKRKRSTVNGAAGQEEDDRQPDPLIGMTISFNAYKEDQEAPKGGTTQVLPVEDMPEEWDGSYEDGMQYLFHVRLALISLRSASQCSSN